jgi:hypothetical protein
MIRTQAALGLGDALAEPLPRFHGLHVQAFGFHVLGVSVAFNIFIRQSPPAVRSDRLVA